MKAVLLSQWFPPENASIPHDIAKGLADDGHDVAVITGFPNYPDSKIYDGWHQRPRQDTRQHGYALRRTALYPSHDDSAVRRALSYFSFAVTSTMFGWRRLRSADVIYVYHPPITAALGPWLSNIFGGAPYVLHVQDLWPDSVIAADMVSGRKSRLVERVLAAVCRSVYHRASAIVAIAPTMSATLAGRGVPQDKLHVIYNWADEAVFFPIVRSPRLADELGFADRFTVMFAGNLGHLQGLDVAIRAAAQVRDLSDFQLVLVGDGVARASLEALARDIGADNVVFHRSRPPTEMNEVTTEADVQLVCLRALDFFKGTIPSKLAAVMASGLPVICAVNGDATTLVERADAGWTCAAEDTSALARAFRDAHTAQAGERSRRGAAARAYYQQELAQSVGVSRMGQIMAAAARSACSIDT